MRTSFILIIRKSCCFWPAFRCVMVASFRCTPVAHARSRLGDALSILWTMTRSWKVALPAPPPLPVLIAGFVTPQEYDSTSISSLCLASRDSPLMSPSLAKMSIAIWIHSNDRRSTDGRTDHEGRRRVETAIFCESMFEAGGPRIAVADGSQQPPVGVGRRGAPPHNTVCRAIQWRQSRKCQGAAAKEWAVGA